MLTEYVCLPWGYRRLLTLRHFSLVGSAAILLLAATLARPSVALATCADNYATCNGTTSGSSSAVVVTNPGGARCYLLLQNTGTTNSLHYAIGSGNAAGTSDLILNPGDSYFCTGQTSKVCPSGDVAVLNGSGATTWAYLGGNC